MPFEEWPELLEQDRSYSDAFDHRKTFMELNQIQAQHVFDQACQAIEDVIEFVKKGGTSLGAIRRDKDQIPMLIISGREGIHLARIRVAVFSNQHKYWMELANDKEVLARLENSKEGIQSLLMQTVIHEMRQSAQNIRDLET